MFSVHGDSGGNMSTSDSPRPYTSGRSSGRSDRGLSHWDWYHGGTDRTHVALESSCGPCTFEETFASDTDDNYVWF